MNPRDISRADSRILDLVTDSRGANTSTLTADAPPPTELVGRRLGEFILRDCIGEGGFGAVYRADQPVLGRQAVVKVLHRRLRASELVLQRFMREALLASRLDHPYAAHVYAFGVEAEDGLAWIAMEKVQGTTLDAWLRQRGRLPIDELLQLFQHVAEVVQTAHDSGIVHRDLKPSNVMVIERAGRILPKLLDFGIAKLVDDAPASHPDHAPKQSEIDTVAGAPTPSGDPRLTQANVTLGSPPYMSPEQWLDPLSVGPAADLYSLGVMAYEALTGRRPFTGSTTAELAYAHCNAPVPALGPGFLVELDAVFQRVLAKKPSDRPPTALVFVAELRAVADLAVVDAPTRGRAPWLVASIAVIVLALAAIVIVVTWRDDSHRASPPPSTTTTAPSPMASPTIPTTPAPAATTPAPTTATTPAATTATTTTSPATTAKPTIPPSPRPPSKHRTPAPPKPQEDLGAGRL